MKFLKYGIALCLALLFLLVPISSLAEVPSSIVQKKVEMVGHVILESKAYPLDHYKMEADIGDGLKDTGDNALHAINQGMWGINKTIASFTLYAINQLMSFDLISNIVSEAGIMSERIYEIMSGTFLSLFVVMVGGIAAWRYFVNQQMGYAVKAILGALAIMILTFWFYSNTTGNIKWLNDRGAELEGIASSVNVLVSSDEFDTNAAYDPKEGIAVLENQLFNLMVKRPYLLLNYGSTKENEVIREDPNRVDKLLEILPYTEEGKEKRSDIVTDESKNGNKQMSPDFSGERFGYLIITLISTIALSIPVLLLGIFKFLLQVWFLALVIFTAIPLVLSLIPSYSESALNHGKKLVGVLMMKSALVLLIAVITGIVTLLYESVKVTNGVEGYAFVVFLICITIWGLFKYRTELFEVASAGMIQGQQVVERVTAHSFDRMGYAGERGFKGAKRIVSDVYRNHQKKKRHAELLAGGAGRKTVTNGAISINRQSEHRKAVGENAPQKQVTRKNQEQQATPKGTKKTSTVSEAGTSTKRTIGIDQKKPSTYRKQSGRLESQNEVAASREPEKYLTKWEAEQQIKNKNSKPSTETVKQSKSRKPKQRK
ncbi:hypothetical protein CN514_05015 [Bacillus sp. AFS001701]|uniref:CD3337/EF1877 family mobilome membrane protein n=1 Tax=Bacillus sp. AFS001701 TaxID=2033480 RepID=UPI000BF7D722|nr:hypothetical protein [Bacillus sp. AFS001701]PET74956.1 hypothetical protein CN514_05015 [Bacillus sp. AFS001701]